MAMAMPEPAVANLQQSGAHTGSSYRPSSLRRGVSMRMGGTTAGQPSGLNSWEGTATGSSRLQRAHSDAMLDGNPLTAAGMAAAGHGRSMGAWRVAAHVDAAAAEADTSGADDDAMLIDMGASDRAEGVLMPTAGRPKPASAAAAPAAPAWGSLSAAAQVRPRAAGGEPPGGAPFGLLVSGPDGAPQRAASGSLASPSSPRPSGAKVGRSLAALIRQAEEADDGFDADDESDRLPSAARPSGPLGEDRLARGEGGRGLGRRRGCWPWCKRGACCNLPGR